MSSLVDVVLFNPVAAGTADFVVSAARLGYLTPAAAAAVNGATYSYRAESADLAQWEVGRGVWNAGSDTLTRAVVLYNSLGNTAKINFTLVPQVGLVALATDVAALDGIAHYTNTTEATGVGTTYAARFEGGVEFAKKVFITGGVGVGGALNVGGNIVGSEIFAGAASFAYGVRGVYSIASGTNNSYMFWGNATNNERARLQVTDSRQLYFSLDNGTTGHLLVTTTNANIPMTTASSSTTTGALTVGGGVGVGGALNVAGVSSAAGLSSSSYVRAADGASIGWGALSATIVGNSSADVFVFYTASTERMRVANTQISISPTTASSSTTTGALIVGGGVGVGGNIVGSEIFAGAASFAYGVRGLYSIASGTNYSYMFWGNATNNERARILVTDTRRLIVSLDTGATNHLLVATTHVNISMTTASSSTTTGALIVGGGVGVGGSIYAGGAIVGVGIYSAGAMKCSHPTGGLGYDTGAGGTVTQATSKSTGVSLSKVSGQITMNAAALAAATIVSFVLTNTAIAATDTLVINHVSGGTPGAYGFNAQCAAGSATINVRNNTAGSLSEAIVLQFNLIKGVTS